MTPQIVLEEQADAAQLLREPVLQFLTRNATRDLIASLEESDLGYSPDHWRDLAAIECLGLLMPERRSGTGHGIQIMATVIELLGMYALPTPIFASAVEAATLISRVASFDEQDELLPAIASGEKIIVVGLHEPAAAPPTAATELQTTAEPRSGGWLVQGTKLYVPYAHAADSILCVARIGDARAAVFRLAADAPGVELTRLRTTNGDPLFALQFSGVLIGEDAVLGGSLDAWEHVAAMLDIAAALKCAELLGIGRRVLELTQELVRVRAQFDQPIGAFQAVQHHVADMYRLVEQTRVLSEQAIALLDNGSKASREVSLAKVKASEGLLTVLNWAQQVHGGVGYYQDYPLETYYRRTMAAQGAYGSAEWHRRRLAELLFADPKNFRRPDSHHLTI